MTQLVYILAAAPSGPCKIGVAANPDSRRAEVQTGNPQRLRVWARCKAEDAYRLERSVHAQLASLHLSGEWFQVTVLDAVAVIHDLIAGRFAKKPSPTANSPFIAISRPRKDYNAYQRDYKKAVREGLTVKEYRARKAQER